MLKKGWRKLDASDCFRLLECKDAETHILFVVLWRDLDESYQIAPLHTPFRSEAILCSSFNVAHFYTFDLQSGQSEFVWLDLCLSWKPSKGCKGRAPRIHESLKITAGSSSISHPFPIHFHLSLLLEATNPTKIDGPMVHMTSLWVLCFKS